MIYLATALSLGLFVWSLSWCRAPQVAWGAIAVARSAMATLRDPTLSDEEKERSARASSCELFVLAIKILARLALATAVPLAFLGVLVIGNVVSLAPIVGVLDSWNFGAVSTIVIAATLLWRQ